uniref:EGF-like domain protein n=1 Tax=Haemonchus contortus TaxID=6289 RepID=A0A7I4YNZ0_HAECO
MLLTFALPVASLAIVLLPGRRPKGTELDKYQSLESSGVGLPPPPKLDAAEDRAPMVREKTDYDPCKASKEMCLNKGKCTNRDGEFICSCPPTHFGKRCERMADTRFCRDHKCQNGGTCLSMTKNQTFMDPIALRKFKKTNPGLSASEIEQDFLITVQYQCICLDGFIGEFCHITEEERSCEEDYCSSHGRGHYDPDSGCVCECDPQQWVGERCDIQSPCASYSCMNASNCTLINHAKENAVEAVCLCPETTELVQTVIKGNHCERIETDEASSIFVPCDKSRNYILWLDAMKAKLRGDDLANLKEIENSCIKLDGSQCQRDNELKTGWCYNQGECHVRVERFASGKLYLVPFCQCKGAESGRFCEYHRKDECDPTAIEKENGVTRENRCTSLHHGRCISPEGTVLCDCFPGYVGEQCEVYDPCARNPCGKPSDCIAIPDEMKVKGDLSAQNYRCLCGMAETIDEQNPTETKCVYAGTGNCSREKNPCHRGDCLSCKHSERGDVLQLCNDNEMKDGFRCVCEPGFKPPYCEAVADACSNHLCANGASCVAKTPFNYDCKCVSGTSGTLCEYVYDYCEAIGNRVCIHGDCYEDPTSTRRFSCSCRFMYYGRNCDRQWSVTEANLQWIMENSNILFPAFSVVCTFVMLFLVYFACLNTISRYEATEDDHEDPKSIRRRKIKVALEQKKNIIRRKRDANQLLVLARKLQAPSRTGQTVSGPPQLLSHVNASTTKPPTHLDYAP